jgi:hypothetical protein
VIATNVYLLLSYEAIGIMSKFENEQIRKRRCNLTFLKLKCHNILFFLFARLHHMDDVILDNPFRIREREKHKVWPV